MTNPELREGKVLSDEHAGLLKKGYNAIKTVLTHAGVLDEDGNEVAVGDGEIDDETGVTGDQNAPSPDPATAQDATGSRSALTEDAPIIRGLPVQSIERGAVPRGSSFDDHKH